MSTRRQFFKLLGAGAMVSVAPEALTEAIASAAPQVVADPMGDWLPLDGAQIAVEELPELAKAVPGWVKDGKLNIPPMQATIRETWHRAVPPYGDHSHGFGCNLPNHTHSIAEAYTVEKAAPARYMVKARSTAASNIPLGTILLFAA